MSRSLAFMATNCQVRNLCTYEEDGPSGTILVWEMTFHDGSAIVIHEDHAGPYIAVTRKSDDGQRLHRSCDWSISATDARFRLLRGPSSQAITWNGLANAAGFNPPRSRGPTVVVGFDFGTHSTKILYRVRNDEVAHVLVLSAPVQNYPLFATPSLVRLDQGRLWFGGMALSREQGCLYRSLKVRLLDPLKQYATENDGDSPSPDLLVACYLAWAFRCVRHELVQRFDNPDIRLNLGAPMGYIEDLSLKTRFLRIVQAAWQSSFGLSGFEVSQGGMLSDIQEKMEQLLTQDVVDESERLFDVLPETVAPLVSLSMDPRMPSGMYMVVDVGAGTTEISVNHTNQQQTDHLVRCYYDRSFRIGGDQLERPNYVTETHHRDNVEELVKNLMRYFKEVWWEGFRKDAKSRSARAHWKDLIVLLTGGGARHPKIYRAIRETAPQKHFFMEDNPKYDVTWHSPANVEDHSLLHASPEDLPLLTVAQGLASERQKWPELFEPASIETLEGDEVVQGTDPYWYL